MSTAAPEAQQPKPKKAIVVKPDKPDHAKFDKAREAADQDLKKVQDELKAVKEKIELAKPGGKSPHQIELKEELRKLRAERSGRADSGAKLNDQIKALDTSIRTRIGEIKTAKDKLPFRSVEALDDKIREMEKKIESGTMRIVEEKKALADISTWNRQRRIFAELDQKQTAIEEDRAKVSELRQQKQDPEKKALEDKISTLQDELAKIQEEQDKGFKNLSSLRDERTRLQEVQNEKWQALQRLKDEFFANKKAYRDYENEAYKVRKQRQAEYEAEKRKEHKRQIATEKMETASQPAFSSEILTCEGLIGFFDPSSAEAARKAKQASTPSVLAAQPTRKVDDAGLKGKKLVKEEEDYFVGGSKKSKGKKNRGSKPATPAPEDDSAPAAPAATGKFHLSAGIFEELAVIGVDPPANSADVPKTLEALREKVKWYKDNQDRVTQENIAKAKKELEKLEAEDGDGDASPKKNGDVTPAEPSTPATPATPPAATAEPKEEDKEEEEKEDAAEEAVKEEAEQNPNVDAEEDLTKDE